MTTARNTRKSPRRGRPVHTQLPSLGTPYTRKLPDGRTLFVEVPRRMVTRDRSGEVAFTPDGVRFLDRLRALAWQPGPRPSPAYLTSLRAALGLTQAELGRRIGRNKLTVSRWECGTLHPSRQALNQLYTLARKRKEAGVLLAE